MRRIVEQHAHFRRLLGPRRCARAPDGWMRYLEVAGRVRVHERWALTFEEWARVVPGSRERG
jgi:hypothetical protein